MNNSCPYCKSEISDTTDILFCPKCKTAHHYDCWREAGLRCTIFGCRGGIPLRNHPAIARFLRISSPFFVIFFFLMGSLSVLFVVFQSSSPQNVFFGIITSFAFYSWPVFLAGIIVWAVRCWRNAIFINSQHQLLFVIRFFKGVEVRK